MTEREEITWVLDEDEEQPRASGDREFAEIPESLKQAVDRELREDILLELHQDAVAEGALPAAPGLSSRGVPGRILSLVLFALVGAALGVGAVVLVTFAARRLLASVL